MKTTMSGTTFDSSRETKQKMLIIHHQPKALRRRTSSNAAAIAGLEALASLQTSLARLALDKNTTHKATHFIL